MIGQERVKAYISLINLGLEIPINTELFYSIIKEGVEILNIPKEELADGVDVSMPTVERWLEKHNAPYRALRPMIYRWLLTSAQLAQGVVNNEQA